MNDMPVVFLFLEHFNAVVVDVDEVAFTVLIIEPVRQVNHKVCDGRHPTVWRSSSNSVAVAIQQCGGSHPTIWQLPQQRVSGRDCSLTLLVDYFKPYF